jgi:DNA-binding winged helix-turn-helix (wHTH) protein/tetratricopeptide (TPR) repeat protein
MDALHGSTEGALTTAEMAAREDFRLGEASVSPSTRTFSGPGGSTYVEPRVMQVLVVLADAAGRVVTRESLFERCWGGVYVGDDSLNRTVAAIRKLAAEIGGESFMVETVRRTGYRLTVTRGSSTPEIIDSGRMSVGGSRRLFIGGGVAAAVVLGGGGFWWVNRSREDRQFKEIMDRGELALDYGHPSSHAPEYFQRATAMRPGDGRPQGLLALAQAQIAEFGQREAAAAAVTPAERAARIALARDPRDPNARLALIILQRAMLDLATTEDRLRQILAMDPGNISAMRSLWGLLQSAGRSRDAFAWVERANAIKPFAAGNNFPRAQLLWILGRTAEADRVIDRAMQYWPSHPWVRAARFAIFAYTDRPSAALAMLDDDKMRPQEFTPVGISLWRVSLHAFEQRSTASIATALKANIEAAKKNPALAIQAIMALSVLGEVDAAFDIANELMLFREPIAPTRSMRPSIRSTAWRFTPWLFTPPVAAMRADRRFDALCEGIGLTEYWGRRGIKPDYQLGIT